VQQNQTSIVAELAARFRTSIPACLAERLTLAAAVRPNMQDIRDSDAWSNPGSVAGQVCGASSKADCKMEIARTFDDRSSAPLTALEPQNCSEIAARLKRFDR
jgi:hypothetical protein